MAKVKRKSVAKKVIDGSRLTIEFTNGKTLSVSVGDLPAEMVEKAAVMGLSHSIGDSYASSPTVAEAVEIANKKLESIMAGEWNLKGEGGGGASHTPMLLDAISRVLTEANVEHDRDEIREEIKSSEGRAQALANTMFKAEFEKIKAEKAAERAKLAEEAAGEADDEADDLAAWGLSKA